MPQRAWPTRYDRSVAAARGIQAHMQVSGGMTHFALVVGTFLLVRPWHTPDVAGDVVRRSFVRHSGLVITVLLRYDHHVDHTFLDATHYRDDDSVLTVYAGEQEVARFPAGSWDGAYQHASTHVREKDGRVRPAQRLEVQSTMAN